MYFCCGSNVFILNAFHYFFRKYSSIYFFTLIFLCATPCWYYPDFSTQINSSTSHFPDFPDESLSWHIFRSQSCLAEKRNWKKKIEKVKTYYFSIESDDMLVFADNLRNWGRLRQNPLSPISESFVQCIFNHCTVSFGRDPFHRPHLWQKGKKKINILSCWSSSENLLTNVVA